MELDENYYKKLGKKLSKIREEKGLTQRKVAEAMGVTFQQYQKYESGSNRIPTKSLVIFCNLTQSDVRELTGVSVKDYEIKYKDAVVNHQHNYHTTYVNNFNGLFSNLFNVDLRLMKNKIAVTTLIIGILIYFLFDILKRFSLLNMEYNATFLSFQFLVFSIVLSVIMFVVFSYSWLTYIVTYIAYIGIFATLYRMVFNNTISLNYFTARIILDILCIVLVFLTFFVLKKCKVNLRTENDEGHKILRDKPYNKD